MKIIEEHLEQIVTQLLDELVLTFKEDTEVSVTEIGKKTNMNKYLNFDESLKEAKRRMLEGMLNNPKDTIEAIKDTIKEDLLLDILKPIFQDQLKKDILEGIQNETLQSILGESEDEEDTEHSNNDRETKYPS